MTRHHTLKYIDFRRTPGYDSYTVGMTWDRDEDHLGVVEAVVSGQDLCGVKVADPGALAATLARLAADDYVTRIDGSETRQTDAFHAEIVISDIEERAAREPSKFVENDTVKEFDTE